MESESTIGPLIPTSHLLSGQADAERSSLGQTKQKALIGALRGRGKNLPLLGLSEMDILPKQHQMGRKGKSRY